MYRIEIITADDLGSGMDGKVFMDIYGENDNSLDIELKDPINKEETLFDRNSLNKFEFMLKNLGKVFWNFFLFFLFLI